MKLTIAQLATFKSWLLANAEGLSDDAAAALANQKVSPNYFAWLPAVRRVDIYTAFPSEGTSWDWVGFKNQGVAEQNAWFEMFMGGSCNFGNQNNRSGVLAIFGTAGAGGSNRTHIFNAARRPITNFEKLFATHVTGAPANTGNDNIVGNQGKATNPDVFGIGADGLPIAGFVTFNDVSVARNS